MLDAALNLLVENSDRLTMTAIARAASCSKETLYNWFGDRDGVLAAIVRRQAAKVRMPAETGRDLDLAQLKSRLEAFACDLLSVLTGDVSVALNRLAISHAGTGKSALGDIVLRNGRFAMGKRLKPLIEAGQSARLLKANCDSEEMFRTFFGLVVRDVQIRLLLGEKIHLNPHEVTTDASAAAQQFLTIYSAKTPDQTARVRAI